MNDIPRRKSGRQPGSKSTYRLTPALIHQAKVMYIAGKTIPEIVTIMGLSSCNTLYNHLKKEKWDEKRQKFMESSTTSQLNTIMENTLVETNRVLDDLKILRDKSIEPIDAGSLIPKKFGEAGSTYMNAVELERKIRAEALHLSFITEVARVLRNRIRDPLPTAQELLIEIGEDLRKLFERRQKELEAPK